jgi:uncharacterized protein (TIGR00369 family)
LRDPPPFVISSRQRKAKPVAAAKIIPNPNYEERVRASFVRQNAMTTIGAALTLVTPGIVEIEMPFSAALTQQHGFLHAGVISAALDSACGYAALSIMPDNAAVLTIEFKVNLLAPGRGVRFLFRGSVTKPGRTIVVADGQAYAIGEDEEAKLIATMTGTMMTILGREGMEG